jgi:hypothetical protein
VGIYNREFDDAVPAGYRAVLYVAVDVRDECL